MDTELEKQSSEICSKKDVLNIEMEIQRQHNLSKQSYNNFIDNLKKAISTHDFDYYIEKNLFVKVKRIDKALPLPKYETNGSVGLDLYAAKETNCPSKCFTLISTNLIIKVPNGYMIQLCGRSSTSYKLGQIVMIGIIDQDYCGDTDEIKIQVYNPTNTPFLFKKEQRLAQALFVKIAKVTFQEVENIKDVLNRGGFGSTGN